MSRSPRVGGVETSYFNTPLPGRWVYSGGFNCAEANKGMKTAVVPGRASRASRHSRQNLTLNPPALRLLPPSRGLFHKLDFR